LFFLQAIIPDFCPPVKYKCSIEQGNCTCIRVILEAIGAGNHTLSEVSDAALVSKAHLSAYLARLQEFRLVERRLPVTTPPAKRRRARSGRYHLSDPYFRFCFRFLAPN
jgi:hypothetical protein